MVLAVVFTYAYLYQKVDNPYVVAFALFTDMPLLLVFAAAMNYNHDVNDDVNDFVPLDPSLKRDSWYFVQVEHKGYHPVDPVAFADFG